MTDHIALREIERLKRLCAIFGGHRSSSKVRHVELSKDIAFDFRSARSATFEPDKLPQREWLGIVSSRLGTDPVVHQSVCQRLSLSILECRRREWCILIAKESAIESWALRAAELFGVPAVVVDQPREQSDQSFTRDELVVGLSDRVDALYVRRKGHISSCLMKRIGALNDCSTRVAVTKLPACSAKELIGSGAVGWLADQTAPTNSSHSNSPTEHFELQAESWMHNDGEWLVHCTRGRPGPWPGQTQQQYQDEILLAGDQVASTPLDSLRRIIRIRRLIGSSTTTSGSFKVVCFSSVALADLIVARCYRQHLKRWDYEPYGIAIRKQAAIDAGLQEVVYGERDERASLTPETRFLFQAKGKTYDWTLEREWRVEGDLDLNQFAPRDVRVFVASSDDRDRLKTNCPWRIDTLFSTAQKIDGEL